MKKVLVLMGRYYPKASPNSICMQRVMDALGADCEFSVICYDDGLKTETDIPVKKIKRGVVRSLIYKYEEASRPRERKLLRALSAAASIKQLPFLLVWPWTDPIVTARTIMAAEKLCQDARFDMVIAVHMPISNLIAAHRLKKRHKELKYVAYFLDSLSGGYVPSFMTKKAYEKKAAKWERRLLENADSAVFLGSSKSEHEHILDGTAAKKKEVYLELPLLTDMTRSASEKKEAGGKSLVYVGSLAGGARSPEHFLKVFSLAAGEDWRLTFIGDASCEALNKFAEKDCRVTVLGRLPHEEAKAFERGADVLINLGNRNKSLTPSKIFEYMSFGKRIASTFSRDDDTSMEYLKKYPAALFLDERGDAAAQAEKLRAFVENEREPVEYDELKKLFPANTPDAFAELVRAELNSEER